MVNVLEADQIPGAAPAQGCRELLAVWLESFCPFATRISMPRQGIPTCAPPQLDLPWFLNVFKGLQVLPRALGTPHAPRGALGSGGRPLTVSFSAHIWHESR